MSKKSHIVKEAVMKKILTGQVAMKPRWYFIVGSISMFLGLIGSTIASVFLMSIISFSLRTHGPMGEIRFQQLVSNFPWWALFIAVFGILSGIWFLKRYDFSYKKNFSVIVLLFVCSILFSGLLMDVTGINASWSKRGSSRHRNQQNSLPFFEALRVGRIGR